MGVSWALPGISPALPRLSPRKTTPAARNVIFVLQDDSEAVLSVFRYLLQWASEG